MELKEKWGLREGWCWHDDKSEAQECLLIEINYINLATPYLCIISKNVLESFENFSETDPREELKVGKFAYFWDDGWLVQEFVVFSKLTSILDGKINKYVSKDGVYKNCSHINPLIK